MIESSIGYRIFYNIRILLVYSSVTIVVIHICNFRHVDNYDIVFLPTMSIKEQS